MTTTDKLSPGVMEAAQNIAYSVLGYDPEEGPEEGTIESLCSIIQRAVAPVEAERWKWQGRAHEEQMKWTEALEGRDAAQAAARELWAALNWYRHCPHACPECFCTDQAVKALTEHAAFAPDEEQKP